VWLVVAAAAASLVVAPAAIADSAPDLPRGIMGATNETAGGTAQRTPTELSQRVETLAPSGNAGEGFSWADAAVGAGVAIAGFVTLTGASHAIRRRSRPAPRPAV